MFEFLASLPVDKATELLSSAAKTDLASYLVIVGVVWKTMGKKVAAHFRGMEDAVKKLTAEVGLLRNDFVSSARLTSSRLDALEGGMLQLRGRVMKLEKPPQGEIHGRN